MKLKSVLLYGIILSIIPSFTNICAMQDLQQQLETLQENLTMLKSKLSSLSTKLEDLNKKLKQQQDLKTPLSLMDKIKKMQIDELEEILTQDEKSEIITEEFKTKILATIDQQQAKQNIEFKINHFKGLKKVSPDIKPETKLYTLQELIEAIKIKQQELTAKKEQLDTTTFQKIMETFDGSNPTEHDIEQLKKLKSKTEIINFLSNNNIKLSPFNFLIFMGKINDLRKPLIPQSEPQPEPQPLKAPKTLSFKEEIERIHDNVVIKHYPLTQFAISKIIDFKTENLSKADIQWIVSFDFEKFLSEINPKTNLPELREKFQDLQTFAKDKLEKKKKKGHHKHHKKTKHPKNESASK